MKKQDLMVDFARAIGDKAFINRSQLKRHMGIGGEFADRILEGLDFVQTKREKKYLLSEVADRIVSMKQMGA